MNRKQRNRLLEANLQSWRGLEMTEEERLWTLKAMLEEDDECRVLDDRTLEVLLDQADGDLRRAAYLGALRKAHDDAVTLPDGTRLESQREYWLTVARSYRTNLGGGVRRTDGA